MLAQSAERSVQERIIPERFKEAARDLECDDERRYDERMKKIVEKKASEKPE